LLALTGGLARAQHTIGEDVQVKCNANDHEILANVMAFQLAASPALPGTEDAIQHLWVQRLVPDPPIDDIREETVFDGVATDLGGGLPPLSESLNGPEIGFDITAGVEIVATVESQDPVPRWFVARWANYSYQIDPGAWEYLPFANPAPYERWGPFPTRNTSGLAKVVYLRTNGPRETTTPQLVWRDLENPNINLEQVLNDPNVTRFGQWVRVDNDDRIMTQYGPPGAYLDRQIALYDVTPPYLTGPLQIITRGPGTRTDPSFRLDPYTGRYTLVNVKSEGADPQSNVIEVHQRIDGVWTKLYEFDSVAAG
jgi:hypothetical protein